VRQHSLDSRRLVIAVILLLVMACNVPIIPQTGSAGTPTASTATLTVTPQNSTSTATTSPTVTITIPPPVTSTITLTSTSTPIPLTPTNTSVPTPCNKAQYVADVNYPDGTEVTVGTNFTKTWRLTNAGSCTWTSGYKIIYVSGDQMSAPGETTLTGGTVPPGATVDISVQMKAPASEGTYRGYFRLKSSDNLVFGINASGNDAFWVEISAKSLNLIKPMLPNLPNLQLIPSKTPTLIKLVPKIPHIIVSLQFP
jgi:hypothetical protein